ncbi:MAG: glycoside hydrolase family 78 protein [Bacteroidaceae bacterium]|nr:glycoside hydrolase family 78 protein [Bacteroidaceae bacterium]
MIKKLLKGWFIVGLSAILPVVAWAGTQITNLRVQDSVEPLALEDKHPLFSWIMESDAIGQYQQAYELTVCRESDGKVMWSTGRVQSNASVNVPYMGVALQPETAYKWQVEVWDTQGNHYQQQSRFETGLMSAKQAAWSGAQWIGSKEVILDAASHNYFQIATKLHIIKGDKASIILGANDFRLKDAFQNIDHLQGENYIRVEFDFSGVGTDRGAEINIYRVGYAKSDKADVPFIAINKEKFPKTNLNEIITSKNAVYDLTVDIETSNIYFIINGKDLITEPADPNRRRFGGFAVGSTSMKMSNATRLNIGPWGRTHDFNTAPHLAEIGFAAMPRSIVEYQDYQINNRGQAINSIAFDQPNYSVFSSIPGVEINGNTIIVSNDSNKMLMGHVDPSHGSMTMLRTQFATTQGKKIVKAKLYATAMGSYEMFINGKRMGNYWFTPGDSQYRETMGYHAFDVTSLLQEGNNAIGAQLSPGWFTGYMTFTTSNYNFFGDNEALLAKLVITYDDGSKQTVVTNPQTWKSYNDGPVRFGSFFQGERYDANYEAAVKGWKSVGFDDNKWQPADIIVQRDWVNFDFMARYDEPVKVRETLTAQRVMPTHSADQHTFIYDMGVNMVGVPQITIPAGYLQKGDVVTLRYAEQLYPGFKGDDKYYVDTYGRKGKNIAGRPLYETFRAALATDFYVAKGDEEIIIQPTTTYRGYQYIQITLPSHKGALPVANIKGLVMSSDQLPTGTYVATTADGNKTAKLVNQLIKNIQRSQLGNFFTIPTDCPQRNERMGWTGDAQAYTRTATYNSDVQNFFRQWMVALRADQGVGSDKDAPGGIGSTVPTYNQQDDTSFADGTTWAAAVCMVPWQLYIQYGNTQIIEENMEAMMAWLNGMDFYDFSEQYPHLSSKASGLADWLAMDTNTPSDLVNNAIYIYMMEVTAIMSDAIGKTDYANILRARREAALKEWNEAYVDSATGKTRSADGKKIIHSQASYATPLNFNCFNEQNKAKAIQYLAELAANPSASGDGSKQFPAYTITTGFSGTPNILPALSRSGKADEAFRMFTCTDFTSWLYPVTKGATSVWERWNGLEVAFGKNNQNNMNSFNHFALGAVGQWMYEYQLGITSNHVNGKAGYQHFILQPTAGANYTSLEGSYRSNYGDVKSAWKADGKGKMTAYQATVPANTSATLYLPILASNFGESKGVSYVGKTVHNGVECAQYELQSGTFSFELQGTSLVVK